MRIKLIALSCLAAAAAHGQTTEEACRRFASAYLGPKPGATVDVKIERNVSTWAGPFLLVTALRSTGAKDEQASGRDQLNMLVDPEAGLVVAGAVFPLKASGGSVSQQNLPAVVRQGLPKVLSELTSAYCRVQWPETPARPTSVMPLTAEVSTGYGYMKLAVAVSADASYLAIGGVWPLDRDPRALRRELLAKAPIQWDPGHDGAPIQLVEFSDYECPACKRGWSEVLPLLAEFGDKIHHGLVNFPLVSQHPWAFRAAVAGVCIGEARPDLLRSLKDEMYRLQDAMTVDSVNASTIGFAKQNGIDEKTFLSCYLKDSAIETVHRQLAVGWSLGILATPTYLVNGEVIEFKDPVAAKARLTAILAAGGLPENAN